MRLNQKTLLVIGSTTPSAALRSFSMVSLSVSSFGNNITTVRYLLFFILSLSVHRLLRSEYTENWY